MVASVFKVLAAVVVGVAGVTASTALETRQSDDTFVVNGDFSQELQGNWEKAHYGCCVTPGTCSR